MKATLSPVARHRLITYPDEPPHVSASQLRVYVCKLRNRSALLSLPKRACRSVQNTLSVHNVAGYVVFPGCRSPRRRIRGKMGLGVVDEGNSAPVPQRSRGGALRGSGNLNARDDALNPRVHIIFIHLVCCTCRARTYLLSELVVPLRLDHTVHVM